MTNETESKPLWPEEGEMFVVNKDEKWYLLDHEGNHFGPYDTDYEAIEAAKQPA